MKKFKGFEKDLVELFGDKIRTDDEFAKRIYAALTNMQQKRYHNDPIYTASFRYVGGLISEIQEKGTYLDWYCCASEGIVDDDIAKIFLIKDWVPYEYPK